MMVEFSGRFIRTSEAFDVAAAREYPQCNCSSGSDQSPDLLDLVESFIDREVEALHDVPDDEEEDDDRSDDEGYEDVKERLREILENHGGDDERRRIRDEVVNASEFVVGEKRDLMTYLRNKGFDSGLCKSRWDKFGKNTSGKYEYVDIKGEDNNNRYIIETNLVGEFEIARPTTRYISLLSQLPCIFVGTPEELKHIVRIMCFEIRKSMKKAKIYLPPWRRNGYMQAKWFGYYKRTCNEVVTKVKHCSCGERIRFEVPGEMTSFKGFMEEERQISDLKIGRLTMAFNVGNEVAV